MTTKVTTDKRMSMKEWLEQRSYYDEFGRPNPQNSLADLPIHIMSRLDAFRKQLRIHNVKEQDKQIKEYYDTKPESTLIKYRGSL